MQQTMSEQLCSGDRESPQSSPPSPSVVPHDTSTVSVTPITHTPDNTDLTNITTSVSQALVSRPDATNVPGRRYPPTNSDVN